jgi:hypothetical protein
VRYAGKNASKPMRSVALNRFCLGLADNAHQVVASVTSLLVVILGRRNFGLAPRPPKREPRPLQMPGHKCHFITQGTGMMTLHSLSLNSQQGHLECI